MEENSRGTSVVSGFGSHSGKSGGAGQQSARGGARQVRGRVGVQTYTRRLRPPVRVRRRQARREGRQS